MYILYDGIILFIGSYKVFSYIFVISNLKIWLLNLILNNFC